MNVLCLLSIMVNVSGIPWSTNITAKGKIVAKTKTTYFVDFRKSLKSYDNLAGDLENYKEVAIERNKCAVVK